jgi:hypothetical protein
MFPYEPRKAVEEVFPKSIAQTAERLAAGLEYRIAHLAEKEQRVKRNAEWDTLDNMPTRLLWEALAPEPAPFFVLYKLLHEAKSVLPKIYRAIAWQLCAAQPARFPFVTYREQLWSVLASTDCWPEDIAHLSTGTLQEFIYNELSQRSSVDWVNVRSEDQQADAQWIAERLIKHCSLMRGFRAIRRIQLSEQAALGRPKMSFRGHF